MVEQNAWAGVPGISSPLHYDAAHNVYLNLMGHKRFLLLPPEATPLLYPFPRLHPSTRQSQLDLRRLPRARFPRFHAALRPTAAPPRLRAREVVLAPGDTLYIPPYTWHRASVAGARSAFSVACYSQVRASCPPTAAAPPPPTTATIILRHVRLHHPGPFPPHSPPPSSPPGRSRRQWTSTP